jgi:hypothetical protein
LLPSFQKSTGCQEKSRVSIELEGSVNLDLGYDIYNVYAALSAVFLLAAAQAFGTMSLI